SVARSLDELRTGEDGEIEVRRLFRAVAEPDAGIDRLHRMSSVIVPRTKRPRGSRHRVPIFLPIRRLLPDRTATMVARLAQGSMQMAKTASFDWSDPFLLEGQLSADER